MYEKQCKCMKSEQNSMAVFQVVTMMFSFRKSVNHLQWRKSEGETERWGDEASENSIVQCCAVVWVCVWWIWLWMCDVLAGQYHNGGSRISTNAGMNLLKDIKTEQL